MTENSVLIDSNILIYAYDKSDEKKHLIAKEAIKKILEQEKGVLSLQNLVEFYSNITTKTKIPIEIETAKQIIIDLSEGFEIITYNQKTITEAINIQAIHKIHFWDALIVATMQENAIEQILTENEKDFKKIKWIKTINPFKNQNEQL